eukprot:jgi/Undpi1/622/HiC_scaffold_10.g04086.m1
MLCRGFSVHADRKPPSRAALLKYVKIATSLKDPALLAMKDVTYLSNREKGHSDFTTFGNARAHVTLKMLVRPEFQQATKIQQEEVYILRPPGKCLTERIVASGRNPPDSSSLPLAA